MPEDLKTKPLEIDGVTTQEPNGFADHPAEDLLDSWKEIANFLGRDVRTVQRWEKSEGLPVHRHVHERQGTVFAYKSEVNLWRRSRITDDLQETEEVPEEEVVLEPPVEDPPAPEKTRSRAEFWMLFATTSVVILIGILAATYLYWNRVREFATGGRPIALAVLPFENLSSDPAEEYFSDGITEELVVQLGRLQTGGVHPIAVSSSSIYKNSKKPLPQIASELGAQYVVQGSVRRSGNQVRISAHLVRAKDDVHLWDENYDRDMKDVLLLQSDVAEAISVGISGNLPARSKIATRAVNPDAYEAYLRGRFFWNKRSPQDLFKAMDEFKKAISIDPTYAPAYVGIADCYTLLGSAQMGVLPPQNAMPTAKAMAEKALSLDPTLAEAHASLAHVTLIFDRDGTKAEKEFQEAIRLNPAYATAHQWYALYLNARGRTADAIDQLAESKRLDPLSPAIHTALSEAYYFNRQFDKSDEEARRALDINPDFTLGFLNRGRALEQLGRYDEAIAAFEQGRTLSGNVPAMNMMVAHAYAMKGDKAKARRILQTLLALPKSGPQSAYVPSIYVAGIYSALGDTNQTFAYLQKALAERCEYLIYLDRDPMADVLRKDKRFDQLLAEARLKGGTHFVPPTLTR